MRICREVVSVLHDKNEKSRFKIIETTSEYYVDLLRAYSRLSKVRKQSLRQQPGHGVRKGRLGLPNYNKVFLTRLAKKILEDNEADELLIKIVDHPEYNFLIKSNGRIIRMPHRRTIGIKRKRLACKCGNPPLPTKKNNN
ncbi:hypothetical protein [Faecalibaculum rodentium]|uniref:hypothetical protein n=1 Tax=Faecalibaculum rodentium TaxID=1702221 RepID=UPI00255B0D06|nr:hypothetical protein [Faecalibaculum rodentium]